MKQRDPALEFYRGEGVECFLRRYPVTDEERRIIYRAVRMAERTHIDEAVIAQADATIAAIRRERQPVGDLEQAIRLDNQEASRQATRRARADSPFRSRWFLYFLLAVVVIEGYWILG